MFHWKDGWYFARTDDGSVRILRQADPRQGFGQPPFTLDTVIDADTWCSLVAHLSAPDDAQALEVVEDLHYGLEARQRGLGACHGCGRRVHASAPHVCPVLNAETFEHLERSKR